VETLPLECHDDDDTVANLVERRFFAALAAVKATQEECRLLHDVIALAEESWRRARARLAELERVRDALGQHVVDVDSKHALASQPAPAHGMLSAA
jgi:hypothetical protein